ncbi:MAG: HPF/RaiA family ribosome-associated protein [Holosporaceae bacterium]|jgi:ribosomal subunit interface protein|nr:HPF/RaiA family ribosome-associated protein [Holosporaceae bacterium]
MGFSFSGRRMEIGETLTNKARDACDNLVRKYGVEFLDVNISMKKDSYSFSCDIAVKTSGGNSYYASNIAEDPHISFDITLEKIDVQMQKRKRCDRLPNKVRQQVEINSFGNSFEESSKEHPIIIAEILDDLPLLSVSDAARRLNEKTNVLIFENVANDAVNVVYSRLDGNIGWIDYKFKR